MRILISEDELALANFLKKGLSAEGYECSVVNRLNEVVPTIEKKMPKIVILDRLFDGVDSIQILSQIKRIDPKPMVLMLTALDEVAERVKGLEQGADDYLCKPFDFDELLARVKVLARRFEEPNIQHRLITVGTIEIFEDEKLAKLAGHELCLTKIEYELLLYFCQNKNKVLTREKILSRVWKTNHDPLTNIIDVYISKLRKKLETDTLISIQTLRGSGYRLNFNDKN